MFASVLAEHSKDVVPLMEQVNVMDLPKSLSNIDVSTGTTQRLPQNALEEFVGVLLYVHPELLKMSVAELYGKDSFQGQRF